MDCPHCGRDVAAVPVGSFDDEPTPVDQRFASYADGNQRLIEVELERHKEESRRAAADLKMAQDEVSRLQAVEVEVEALRRHVAQLKLALAGRNRKG